MYHIAICDDEIEFVSELKDLLKRYSGETGIELMIAEYRNGQELIENYDTTTDLIFLDIQMPGITGIEFAQSIPVNTLIVFTTAYAEYALDSYEVSAIDYLVKPIEMNRFLKAVNKAIAYHKLLLSETAERVEEIQEEYIFIKSERRYIKINFSDILFIEGLKDYSILQLEDQRVITKMNLKNIHEQLPAKQFLRINKSYIVNTSRIDSFDTNDIFIKSYEIGIGGGNYKKTFFEEFVAKNLQKD